MLDNIFCTVDNSNSLDCSKDNFINLLINNEAGIAQAV
jgi:hypothetical protein